MGASACGSSPRTIRTDELLAGGVLQHIPGRARAKGFSRELSVSVHRQKDDFGAVLRGSEPAQSLQAAQHRHGDIRDDHVWMQLPGGVDHLAPVTDDAYKVKVIFQKGRQTLGDDRVIIGQQHFWTSLHAASLIGTRTRSSVPRCG